MDTEAKADVDVWWACLGSTCGQCWLVIGSARGEVGVLGSKGTEETCAGLNIHCGSDFIFTSVLCKIIDVMTLFSKVE